MKKGTLISIALVVLGGGILSYHYNPTIFDGVRDILAQEKTAHKTNKTAPASQAGKKKKGKKRVRVEAEKKYSDAEIAQMLQKTPWTDCAAQEKQLAASIMQALPGTDRESVEAFLKNRENRLLLTQWELAHRENAADATKRDQRREALRRAIAQRQEKLANLRTLEQTAEGADRDFITQRVKEATAAIKALEDELNSPRSMKETLDTYPESVVLLHEITSDPEWMEQLLYTGECENPGRMLALFYAIAQQTPNLTSEAMPRAIATATALEWAKHDWDFNIAPPRAAFFIDNDRDNRFHSGFRTLPFWQIRLLCASKGNDENGSVESLQWALDNVHLPSDRYSGSCWQANYLTENLFGDSVHGADYYGAYDGVYKKGITGRNALRRTYEVGGVCGSLSHFGAMAALANGVPALPMGEPEHCAYVVLVNGKWTPAYSLSWQRGLHWEIWKHVNTFSSLHLASELYDSHGKNEETSLSNAYSALAKLYASQGMTQQALDCYLASVKLQPNNYPAWRAYAAFIQQSFPDNEQAWSRLNDDLCRGLVPRYPEIAAGLLRAHVYPHIHGLPAQTRTAMCSAFWNAVEGMGPDRWDIEALCSAQLRLMSGDSAKPDAATANALYGIVLQHTVGKPAYAPVILSWGNNLASAMGEETQRSFLQSTLNALSSGGSMETADRDRMLGQALRGAANMHDRSSFQAIGKLLSEKYHQPQEKLPAWQPFPGKLVSQGGLLRVSSTSQYDDPAAHWGILEPSVGGRFHTDKVADAYAVVELPKMAYISGVVTIAPGGNLERLSNLKVQYSESGKDDDWHDAGAMPAPTTERVNRLDLQEKNPRARFIRILRPGGPEYFHLFGIFVYGKPAA